MNEREKLHCLEFAQLLLGDLSNGAEVKNLIEGSESLANFRVDLILKFEGSVASIKKIATQWRESIYRTDAGSDHNELWHTTEIMVLKQYEIEHALRGSTSEMLDKLKTVDSFATRQAAMRDELAVMSDLIGRFGSQAASADTLENAKHQDVNELMHTNELLVLKQQEIRQNLRESTASLLDNLKAIDVLATTQVNLKRDLAEVSNFLSRFQNQATGMQTESSELQRRQ